MLGLRVLDRHDQVVRLASMGNVFVGPFCKNRLPCSYILAAGEDVFIDPQKLWMSVLEVLGTTVA